MTPRPTGRIWALCAATVLATLVIAVPLHSLISSVVVVLSTVACGTVAVMERRTPRLGLRPIVAAIGLVFVVAVAVPPRASNDVWSYTMYGRAVSVYHTSPYKSVPADFSSDPFFKRVSPRWRSRGSVYGPVFVGYAAAGTALAGDSVTADRLFFQLSAAAAAAGILWLIWRRTRSPAALVWIGLHPMLGPVVVNGAHNDIYIGLAAVVAALFAVRRNGGVAGFVLGLATLIKITAVLGLAGLVLWAWRQRLRRVAVSAMAAAALIVTLGYLPFLSGALHVLGGADKTVTPASLWNPLAAALVGHDAGRLVPHPLAPDNTLVLISFAGLAVIAVLAITLGWRAARADRPEPAMGVSTAAYMVAAEYTFPWYASWTLPLLVEDRPSPVAWVVWAQAALMIAALKLPIHPRATLPDITLRGLLTYAAPIIMFVAFVGAVIYQFKKSSTAPTQQIPPESA